MRKRRRTLLFAIGGVLFLFVVALAFLTFLLIRHEIGRRQFWNAYAEMNRRNYDDAIVGFTSCLRFPLGSGLRAYAFGNRGYSEARKDRRAEALADFDAALRLSDRLGFAYAERSWLRLAKGDDDGAWRDASRAIALDPNATAALSVRANISARRGQWDDTIRDYSDAIRSYPKNAEAYVQRALAYEHKNDLEHALASLDSAVAIAPSDVSAYLHRGYLYQQQHEPEKALADFSAALRIVPGSIDALRARARLFADWERWSEAIADCSALLHLQPRDELALRMRASFYTRIGEYERGVHDYSELIRITQARVAYDLRAGAALREGKYQEALADYRAGAQLSGKDETVKRLPWLLATCPDATIRDGAEALKLALQDCERTHWKSWSCIDTAAAACAEMGNLKQAIAYEEQALGFNEFSGKQRELMEHRLALYKLGLPYREAPRW